MLKRRFLAGILMCSLVLPACSSSSASNNNAEKASETITALSETESKAEATGEEIVLEKCTTANPIGGLDTDGNHIYGGDPAVLVDGDTIYLYTGHDTAVTEAYNIPEWMCYSTKDMVNWTYEGVIMKANRASISWANTGNSAWAGQVEKYNGKYYFYYCTWDSTSGGKQSIGVAVSDSPTGPFVDKGEPIVKGTDTEPETSGWNDIDPTVWVETDENGEEHRYLAWGNGKFYVCELNEDMISVKDINGDGEITCGTSAKEADIIEKTDGLGSYTEAPWLYRRKDENGNAYGSYYLFYAYGWREQMAYATTDDLLNGSWTFGAVVMPPTATSNTNHMAVFDFKGKTYFVYHNGSLSGGSGFRRVACITQIQFNDDGSIDAIPESAAGVSGETSVIYTSSGSLLGHESFINSGSDSDYPYTQVAVGDGFGEETSDQEWVIVPGKADTSKEAYVSIQSENKPGLYLTANEDKTVTLAQDTDASDDTAKKQTFRTIQGLADENGVTFESVSQPENYLTIVNGTLTLTDASNPSAATFYMDIDETDSSLRSIGATLKEVQFHTNEAISTENVVVTAFYANGTTKQVTDFTTNASSIDTSKTGEKTLEITYQEGDITKTAELVIKLVQKVTKPTNFKVTPKVKKKNITVAMKWTKASSAKGYEISYGLKKSRHKYLTTEETTSYTSRNTDGVFKKGKTYYIHVRAYKTFNGKKEYSEYVTKKVTIK